MTIVNDERNRGGALKYHLARIGSVGATAIMVSFGPAYAAGDVVRGEDVYQGCEDCHSLDKNDVGPKHRDLIGRKAGTVPDYNYSPALKKSNLVWTEGNLDKWLTNPQELVPGTKMFYKLDNPQDRADVIEYLKERAR